jgi:hypothetical protein
MRPYIFRPGEDNGNGVIQLPIQGESEMNFRASSISVMAAGGTMNAWPVGTVSGNGLKNLRRWGEPQGGRERQNERRHDAKSEHGEQNGQGEAEYVRRAARNAPDEPSGDETRRRGDHPAAIRNLQQRLAMRALQAVGKRHNKRRRNRLAAVRTHSSSHSSPHEKQTKIAQMSCQGKLRNNVESCRQSEFDSMTHGVDAISTHVHAFSKFPNARMSSPAADNGMIPFAVKTTRPCLFFQTV